MEFACELSLEGGDPDYSSVPRASGIVRLEFRQGRPYLGRTADLRRRLVRLLADEGSRRGLLPSTTRAEYQRCGSPFETAWVLLQAAREVWPDDYRRRLHLRTPAFLRVLLTNEFPRTTVTRRLVGARTAFFGPFRSRTAAERFETEMLDLFQIRRCVENLKPSAEHPGCVWGEIGKCSRPCQQAVSVEEYRGQAGRLLSALETSGERLKRSIAEERDQASESLEFERAAKLHVLLEKASEAFRTVESPACELGRFHGVVVQRSSQPEKLLMWPLYQGWLQSPQTLEAPMSAASPVSLDQRVREALAAAPLEAASVAEREDDQALLGRWWFRGRRQGELVVFDRWDRVPYRKLVNAVSRVARGESKDEGLTAAMRRREREARDDAGPRPTKA